MSGALPNMTASIASHSTLAANMALSIASRTNPPMDTSLLLASYLVCPTPITPAWIMISSPNEQACYVVNMGQRMHAPGHL